MRILLVLALLLAAAYSQESGAGGTGVTDANAKNVTTQATTTTTTGTTTTAPTTTTTSATTTTVKPTTSTSAPTTSTAKPTTPTPPKPTPVPSPETHTWNVTQNNVTCIIAKMAVQLRIPYVKVGNESANSTFNVPKNATASGQCGKDTNSLTLTWDDYLDQNFSLTFVFTANTTKNQYYVSRVTGVFSANSTVFHESMYHNITIDATNLNKFPTPLNRSYICDSDRIVSVNTTNHNGLGVGQGTVRLSDFRLQAFSAKKDGSFYNAIDCIPENPSDVVPIAVGCALAALVIIVLIAYLVGRRRSRARGYQSV